MGCKFVGGLLVDCLYRGWKTFIVVASGSLNVRKAFVISTSGDCSMIKLSYIIMDKENTPCLRTTIKIKV